ncbi:hypothetical protein CDD81_2153 [Ophiocordyceps australis]|uniref:Metallo-beta-lactamase domain-containing protein n=1 Tax=Ophiocordyceps australis TaxID=1399860 RepID=A0A2C5XUD9_9HYPO|nr:hypothetical protein CDD81_2153 [Ophiocordyceps australis]
MALTIKQLNGDASFHLTLEPIQARSSSEQYHMLIDPWIAGPSSILHPKFSSTSHVEPACISSLRELPEPDVVIISHNRSSHCHEATLRQLAPKDTKTLILAVPAAARLIRSWNYFDKNKVKTLDRWEHPRKANRDTCYRIPVPSQLLGGGDGEVTVSYISHRKRHPRGHHCAIGITYRPPTSESFAFWRQTATPPLTPSSTVSALPPRLPAARRFSKLNLPPSMSWAANLGSQSPPGTPLGQTLRQTRPSACPSPHAQDRCVSVIFSPHGIPYSSLEPYATSHLLTEAALPLTALLHCFETVHSPWCLGSKGNSGIHTGQEIATALGARAWISTYDGNKIATGLAGRLTGKSNKYDSQQMQHMLRLVFEQAAKAGTEPLVGRKKREDVIEILALKSGAQVTLTSEGIWSEPSAMASAPVAKHDGL